MSRIVRWVAFAGIGTLVFMLGVAAAMRLVGSDPAVWHVPVSEAVRPGASNDYLAATASYADAAPDLALAGDAQDAVEWLEALDHHAMGEPRVERVAGSPAEGRITWVQRSAVFGFPDYITAEARDAERAIWSRSRYGRSDFGVNRARVERWLSRLGS